MSFQPYKVLEFEVQGNKVETWIDIDDDVWTGFLSKQPGYVSKGAYYPQDCDRTKTDYCLVTWVTSSLSYKGTKSYFRTVIYWTSLQLWKDITNDMMTDVYADMANKSKEYIRYQY